MEREDRGRGDPVYKTHSLPPYYNPVYVLTPFTHMRPSAHEPKIFPPQKLGQNFPSQKFPTLGLGQKSPLEFRLKILGHGKKVRRRKE